MQLVVSINDIDFRVAQPGTPKKPHPIGGLDHVCMSTRFPPYLLVGLSTWFPGAKLVRVELDPLNKHHEKEGKRFLLTGTLPKDKKRLSNYHHAALFTSLEIPIHSKNMRFAPQRHSKALVCYLEDILPTSSSNKDSTMKYRMKLTNKINHDDVLCSFTLIVHELPSRSSVKTLEPYLRSRRENDSLRKAHHLALESIRSYYIKKCIQTRGLYQFFMSHTKNRNKSTTSGFFGDDPNFNYFNVPLPEANEAYFIHLFEIACAMKKTEHSVDLSTSSEEFYWNLPVFDQEGLRVLMLKLASQHSPYLPDATINSKGELDWEEDDWSENINEGGDDCDGKTNQVEITSQTFSNHDAFQHKVLEEMRQRSWRYVSFGCTSSMVLKRSVEKQTQDKEKKTPPDPPKSEMHLTGIFILKSHFFGGMRAHLSSKIYEEDCDIEGDLFKLMEIEKNAGNLNPSVKIKGKLHALPTVIFGEATMPLYPYNMEYHKPPRDVLQKQSNFMRPLGDLRKFSPIWTVHQREGWEYICRFFTGFTTYFVKHPLFPINLPSVKFTTLFEKTPSMEKGISPTEITDPKLFCVFPSACLYNLKKDMEVLTCESYYRFGYCPLVAVLPRETDSLTICQQNIKTPPVQLVSRISEDRNSEFKVITPPNLSVEEQRKIGEFLPSSIDHTTWFAVSSLRIHNVFKHFSCENEYGIAGLKYIEILPHITIYMVWIQKFE